VAGHGDFPQGIVSAVGQITGRDGALIPFSNNGLCRDEIETGLRACLDRHNVHVVFTDLPAGSTTIATRRLMRADPSIVLVTGVNMAALIDFVFCDVSRDVGEAARHAAEKGGQALTVYTGAPAER